MHVFVRRCTGVARVHLQHNRSYFQRSKLGWLLAAAAVARANAGAADTGTTHAAANTGANTGANTSANAGANTGAYASAYAGAYASTHHGRSARLCVSGHWRSVLY